MSQNHNCGWKCDEGDDVWVTDCGEYFQFLDGTPSDNSFRFCPYCGGKLIATEDSDDGANAMP